MKLAIIGVGKMGGALAKALKDQVLLSNKSVTNTAVAQQADVVILAVKPLVIQAVCEQIGPILKKRVLVISIAAGIRMKKITNWLGKKNQAVVRAMPNLALPLGLGMTGWTANRQVSLKQKQLVRKIFSACGREIYFKDESALDRVTAISGSGPAYFFYAAEALIKAGQKIGLSQAEAKLLVIQTINGATGLLNQSNKSAKGLRLAVTSKGGTTEAAVKVFEKEKLSSILEEGVKAAYRRARALGG